MYWGVWLGCIPQRVEVVWELVWTASLLSFCFPPSSLMAGRRRAAMVRRGRVGWKQEHLMILVWGGIMCSGQSAGHERGNGRRSELRGKIWGEIHLGRMVVPDLDLKLTEQTPKLQVPHLSCLWIQILQNDSCIHTMTPSISQCCSHIPRLSIFIRDYNKSDR